MKSRRPLIDAPGDLHRACRLGWLPASLLLAVGWVSSSGAADATAAPRAIDPVALRSIDLWDGDAPQAKGHDAEDRPHLDVFLASRERANGCAMIVCPGGGFRERAMDWEGVQVAQWLNTQGIAAFVLSYRIRPAGYDRDVAFLDGARAVRLVRTRAAALGVSPRRVGVIGFSAGSVIASQLGATFADGAPQAADPVERASSRPDFVVAIYGRPVRQEGAAPVPVPADTPPTFTVLTTGDQTIDPQASLREYQALRQAGVETELHIFGGDGAHGRGLYAGDPATGEWPALLVNWLRRNALLTERDRVSVEGVMTIDGVPMFAGWVTFLPVDDPNLPEAAIFYNDKYRKPANVGRYAIAQKFGPVPGRYRVEVRHVSKDFALVPSMTEARVYTSLTPGAGPIVVELQPGANTVDLAIRTR